jgi:hypothetical protein
VSDREEFSVYQFFLDDSCERVASFVGAREAVERAHLLSRSLGARLGTTRRIVITDGGDYTVFEWRHGKGVTFPPREARQP